MTTPASNSVADSSDIKRPSEFYDSDSLFKKRIKTGEESENQVNTAKASNANSSAREGFFEIEADAAEDKGSRHTMEDAWVVLHDAAFNFPGILRCAHFAIYDGHGGRLAADYAQKHLNENVLSAGLPRELLDVKSAKKAILNGGWQDGATAVCVWILDQTAGGSVSTNGRLQGRLEVSRAFGDRQFKKVGVVAIPDVSSFDLTGRDHFIILGCDGLWGVFGPSDAVAFVHRLLQEGQPVTTISRRLVREAIRERQCKDNCTAIVIVFRQQ
ncbi:probable protein phosphatase 2C 8 isoform X6 [Andrographis paniculata]|uniref:probable protein phosphatase 2C 8 isoform X6 n=1 Tax=Andrographis paniculata TaxID=175694 RepID=UPI0021E92BD4|nr:probable protein phosphatase 2C 8 isoform X6 [Andrographis paniculata]